MHDASCRAGEARQGGAGARGLPAAEKLAPRCGQPPTPVEGLTLEPPSKVQQRPQGVGSRVRPCGKGVGGGRTRRVSGSCGMWLEAGARQCWGLRHLLAGQPQQCCPATGRGQGLKLRGLWCACKLHAVRLCRARPGARRSPPASNPARPRARLHSPEAQLTGGVGGEPPGAPAAPWARWGHLWVPLWAG